MKQGLKSIESLYGELMRQREMRKDLIADTRSLTANTEKGKTIITVNTGTDLLDYQVTEIAHRQIAERLNIPFKYYERMRADFPMLLDANINGWLKLKSEKRMLRTLDGNLRAFLSNRYRRLDNLELVDHILPVIAQMKNCTIASCDITETHLYLKVINKSMKAEITKGDIVQAGFVVSILPVIAQMKNCTIASCDITETHLYLKVINKSMKAEITKGDIVQAGFVVSNSEIGLGALKVEPLVYRLVCKNGMISRDYAHKKYHTGRNVEDTDNAYELYSDETLEADDKAYFMKVQDIVSAAVDETKFLLTVDKMRQAKTISTGNNPVETVEVLGDKYILNKVERASVLRHFIMDNDFSQFGLVNAVTRASQDVDNYNRATELERIGGTILEDSIKSIKQNKLVLLPRDLSQDLGIA